MDSGKTNDANVTPAITSGRKSLSWYLGSHPAIGAMSDMAGNDNFFFTFVCF
jgi:hypothetical protein